jgi:uncharacterized membrane protein YedE/YeeE
MELVITGLFIGVLFGFVLQRGRFCMNSAFRDIVLFQDYALFKTVAAAVLVSLAGFAIMDLAGVITLAPKPLWWGANLLGSFVFGIGMVVAGGCASGVTYRVGEGMVGAMTAVLGLTIGAYVTAIGFLSGFKNSLQESTKIVAADGSSLTLANVLGIDYAVLALGIFVVVVVVWFIVAWKKYEGDNKWGWLTTGFLIGMVAIIAWPLSAAAGRNYPLGITAGWIGIAKKLLNLTNPEVQLNWIAWLIIGTVVGSFIAALIARELKLRVPPIKRLLITFGGGLLMGFGAVLSGGCNITHILSGFPQLSLGSFLAGISIILGAWLMSYIMFVRPMKKAESGE